MRNKIILFLTCIICFFLQCSLCKKISIGSIAPNLLVIFIVSMGLMRGKTTGLFVGFFLGILTDLFYGDYLGIYAFIYMCIGYLSGYTFRIYYDNNIKVPMILTAMGDLVYNIGVFLFMFLLRGRTDIFFFIQRIMIPEVIYTVLMAAIVYKIFYLINHRFMKQNSKERDSIWLLR